MKDEKQQQKGDQMKRCIITGGCGFIGSHVVDYLINNNHRAFIIDNMRLGKNHWGIGKENPVLHQQDILNLDACTKIFDDIKPDVCIHLAAYHYIPFCEKNVYDAYALNLTGTLNVLECCRRSSVKKFFLASTGDVYAPGFQPHREVDLISPIYVYGHTKMLAEQACIKYYESSMSTSAFIIGRLFNAAGARETNPHLLPEVVHQIANGKRRIEVGNTWPLRDFVDVRSMASIIAELTLNASGIDIVNIGSGSPQTVTHILNELVSVLPFTVEIISVPEKQRPNDRPYLCPDINRLFKLVGRSALSFSVNTAKDMFNEFDVLNQRA